MINNFSWTKSKRGKNIIIFYDLIYNFDKKIGTITTWRCRRRKCRGSVNLSEKENPTIMNDHNHPADKIKIEAYLSLSKIKESTEQKMAESSNIDSAIT